MLSNCMLLCLAVLCRLAAANGGTTTVFTTVLATVTHTWTSLSTAVVDTVTTTAVQVETLYATTITLWSSDEESSSSSNSQPDCPKGGIEHVGQVALYAPGCEPNACNIARQEGVYYVAVYKAFFTGCDPNPNNNPVCGSKMRIHACSSGRSIVAVVVDKQSYNPEVVMLTAAGMKALCLEHGETIVYEWLC